MTNPKKVEIWDRLCCSALVFICSSTHHVSQTSLFPLLSLVVDLGLAAWLWFTYWFGFLAHIHCLSSVVPRHQMAAGDQQTQGEELMLQGMIPSYVDMDREQGDPDLSMESPDQETSEFYSPIQDSLDTKCQTVDSMNAAVHYVNIPFHEAVRYQPLCAETLNSPNPYTIRVKTVPPTVILKDGGKEYCICDKDQMDKPRVYQLPTQSGRNTHEN